MKLKISERISQKRVKYAMNKKIKEIGLKKTNERMNKKRKGSLLSK